jgi:hypothetical protein
MLKSFVIFVKPVPIRPLGQLLPAQNAAVVVERLPVKAQYPAGDRTKAGDRTIGGKTTYDLQERPHEPQSA